MVGSCRFLDTIRPNNYSAAIIKMDSNGIIYPNQVSALL